MKKIVKINGMHCPSCEVLLKEAIEEKGIRVISASFQKGEIVVDVSDESFMKKIKDAVKSEGYSVV